jgi:hypothetical protein
MEQTAVRIAEALEGVVKMLGNIHTKLDKLCDLQIEWKREQISCEEAREEGRQAVWDGE